MGITDTYGQPIDSYPVVDYQAINEYTIDDNFPLPIP